MNFPRALTISKKICQKQQWLLFVVLVVLKESQGGLLHELKQTK